MKRPLPCVLCGAAEARPGLATCQACAAPTGQADMFAAPPRSAPTLIDGKGHAPSVIECPCGAWTVERPRGRTCCPDCGRVLVDVVAAL